MTTRKEIQDLIESFNNAIYCLICRQNGQRVVRFRATDFAASGIARAYGEETKRYAGDVWEMPLH